MPRSGTKPQLLEIALLGGLRLSAGGRSLSVPRRSGALLAYLALRPDLPTSREAIAELIWPGRSASEARHSLRQALTGLRGAFKAAGVDPLRTDGGSALYLIGDRFRTDLSPEGAESDPPDPARLPDLLARHTAPLLDGLAPISNGFDDWLRQQRAQWNDRALAWLDRLANAYAAADQPEAAVLARERAIAIDPLREDQHRFLMEAYAAAGRRADAIRQFQDLTAILARELKVAPAPETQALHDALRRGNELALPPSHGLAEPPVPALMPPDAREPVVLRVEPRLREGPPWIAVLPLRALGPDPVPDYFSAGLVDDVVNSLATQQDLMVVAAGSCLVFQNQPVDLVRLRDALGVRYVVHGTIRKAGPSLRISVQLAETEGGAVLWGQPYNTTDTELFSAQDNITHHVATTVIPRIREAELRRIQGKHPSSLSAYDMVLRARALIYRLERQTFDEAGSLLRHARLADPRYSVGHALFAEWLNLRIGQGWSLDPQADATAADNAAHDALSADHLNARALALLGHSRSFLFRDYIGAKAIFQRALDASPNDSTAWMWSAVTFAYTGDADDALRRAEHGLALSPFDPHAFRYYGTMCLSHYTNGAYDKAVEWGERAIAANPSYTSNLRFTAAAMAALGRLDGARQLCAEIMRIEPDFRVGALLERHPYAEPERRTRIAAHLRAAGLPE